MFLGDVVKRHLLGSYQISSAHLVRLDAGLVRDSVEQEFEGETHAGARYPAIRQDRTFVGSDREGATPVGRKIIRSRKNARHLRGFQAGGERVRRVGAGIDDGFAIDTAQAAVAVGVGRDAVMVLTAIGAGNQVLAPVLDPSNRMAAMHGEPAEAISSGNRMPL